MVQVLESSESGYTRWGTISHSPFLGVLVWLPCVYPTQCHTLPCASAKVSHPDGRELSLHWTGKERVFPGTYQMGCRDWSASNGILCLPSDIERLVVSRDVVETFQSWLLISETHPAMLIKSWQICHQISPKNGYQKFTSNFH